MASLIRSPGSRSAMLARCSGSKRPCNRFAESSGSQPIASRSARTVSHVGVVSPRSMRLTAAWVVPARSASER